MLEPLSHVVSMFVDQPDAQEDDEVWVLDSSVRKHYVRCKKLLRNSHPCYDEKYKWGFSGLKSLITYTGDASLPSQGQEEIGLRNVSCVPDSVHYLISVSELTTNFPFCVIFYPSGFVVKNLHTRKEIAKGQLDSNQYLWPRTEAKPKDGIKSMINSIHKKLISSFKELAPEDPSDAQGLGLGLELQEAWACHRTNIDDVETRDLWILSSYSTQHITNDRTLLRNLRPLPEEILIPDFTGRTSPAIHIGDAYLLCSRGEGIVLHEVLLVPESSMNYISVAQLISEYPSCSLEFRSEGFVLRSLDENRLIADGPKYPDLYLWLNRSKRIACSRRNEKNGESSEKKANECVLSMFSIFQGGDL